MKLSGEHQFPTSREVVWSVISDPTKLSGLMPGVQTFEVQDDRHFRAHVKIPLGLGRLEMAMDFEKLEERPPEFSTLKARGRGVGAMMGMETSFTLEEADGGTRMLWTAEVSIAGPVGAMGQRVLQPIFRQQVDHVLAALETQVAAASAGAQPAAVAAADSGPDPGETASSQPAPSEPATAEPQ